MNFALLIRPEARDEIEQAFDWYESCRDGLGLEFERCLEEALARIVREILSRMPHFSATSDASRSDGFRLGSFTESLVLRSRSSPSITASVT